MIHREGILSKKNYFSACRVGQFGCGNGVCIPQSWLCEGENDFLDGTDEQDYLNSKSNISIRILIPMLLYIRIM